MTDPVVTVLADQQVQGAFRDLAQDFWLQESGKPTREEALISAILSALGEGVEGLDFEAAYQYAQGTHGTVMPIYREHIDAQHRAIVGALRAKLAMYEGSEWTGEVCGMVDTALKAHGVETAPMFFDDEIHRVFAKLADAEKRVTKLKGALKPFADLAGSGEGFCSPNSTATGYWCNNHRANYDEIEAMCDVVKAAEALRGTP